ncbi:MAG TPA: hypothetical protein VIL66_07265 [Bacillota bacterium]
MDAAGGRYLAGRYCRSRRYSRFWPLNSGQFGSPRGVRENLEVIFPVLEHGLELVTGRGGECGDNEEVCVNS